MLAHCIAFIASFSMFWLEVIVAKDLLPVYGGGAGIWIACLLVFQCLLFIGYYFADRVSRQKYLPFFILLYVLAVIQGIFFVLLGSFKSDIIYIDVLMILAFIFILLATTTPLLHRLSESDSSSNYYIYAFSNAASLSVLLLFPFILEPLFSIWMQKILWGLLFVLYLVLYGTYVYKKRDFFKPIVSVKSKDKLPLIRIALLSALPTAMLVAFTQLICQDVAPVPFMWIIPLLAYLLSLILAFSKFSFYSKYLTYFLTLIAAFALLYNFDKSSNSSFAIVFVVYSILCFWFCYVCHCELAALKPKSHQSGSYYLWMAFFSGVGTFVAHLVIPLFFVDYYEVFLLVVIVILLHPICILKRSEYRYPNYVILLIMILTYGSAFYVGKYFIDLLLKDKEHRNTEFVARNIYGVVRVVKNEDYRFLWHGKIIHGVQFNPPHDTQIPLSYYHKDTGVFKVVDWLQSTQPAVRVGVLGLGAGTLVAQGRPEDEYIFYEINPVVSKVAKSHFSYLLNAKSKWIIKEGDGRLTIGNESDDKLLDVLVLDAFSGDGIPTHLLTLEAFQTYQRRLSKNGFIAVNVTNAFVDLKPVLVQIGSKLGLETYFYSTPYKSSAYESTEWMILTSNEEFQKSDIGQKSEKFKLFRQPVLWTDQYSSLFPLLR